VVNQGKAADVAIIEFEAGARNQFSICQRLRSVDQSTPIAIIGVLRSSSPHLAAKGIDAGAFYVLEPKPSASMLQAVVRAALHRRAMDTQLTHTSTTSMMPRVNFGREVASAASSCDQHHIPFGLMLCEISNYAEILEALGDAHIDELYEYVGTSFLRHLEAYDSVGQWEASQIAVLLEHVPAQKATDMFGHLLKSVDQKPLTIAGTTVCPVMRAGIALSPEGERTDISAEHALQAARRSLDAARDRDAGRIQITKMLSRIAMSAA
jgi:GGDEF domain-containing protein